jgi:hypothetical protein
MRRITSRAVLAALLAAAALVAATGLSPAEAKGGPPPSAGKGSDKTAPTITCPSGINVDATGSSGTYVSFSATATDDKDPWPTVTVNPKSGSLFPVGTTTVTVTAKDWKNNTSTKTFNVTVSPLILPAAYAGTYKAYWSDYDGYPFYEWDITIASNGTITGTGHQTALFLDYSELDQYSTTLPDGLAAEGVVSGTVGSDGVFHLTSSADYWYSNGYDPDDIETSTGFSGTSTGTRAYYGGVYAGLRFDANVLGSPSNWDSEFWAKQ